MVIQLQNSHLRCPHDKTRLAFNPVDCGQNDADGDYEEVHFCVECTYRETVRPERDKPDADGRAFLERVRDRTRDPNKPLAPPAAFEPYLEAK